MSCYIKNLNMFDAGYRQQLIERQIKAIQEDFRKQLEKHRKAQNGIS